MLHPVVRVLLLEFSLRAFSDDVVVIVDPLLIDLELLPWLIGVLVRDRCDHSSLDLLCLPGWHYNIGTG